MKDSAITIALKLLLNGLKFQVQKKTGKPGRVQALSLEITHKCIARCIMCNIWKIPKDVPDLSNDDWLHLLSSKLFTDLRELDITGGEPFLRKELPQLFEGICDLKQSNFKRLKSIAVTTNGLLTGQILDATTEILPILKRQNLDLVMVCAMDAIGDLHDRIRNYKAAWSKVNDTIEGLNNLRERYENLLVGIKTTILPINIGELEKIAHYAESKGLFTIISPLIITEGRYLNNDLKGDFVFSREDKKRIISFLENQSHNWNFYNNNLVQYFRTGRIYKPCTCGFNYLFIRSNGDMYLCPLLNLCVGNIKEDPIEEIFLSKSSAQIRRKINKFPECKECTEPGLERYSLPHEGLTYFSLFFKMGMRDFIHMHQSMGLDKYI